MIGCFAEEVCFGCGSVSEFASESVSVSMKEISFGGTQF